MDSGIVYADGFCSQNHEKKCLSTLYDLYNEKRFVDVSFYVGTQKFEAHKIILAANSEFFMENLNSADTEYDFEVFANCNEIVMDSIMRYCYTGKIDFDSESISSVLHMAELLRMPALINGICNTDSQ